MGSAERVRRFAASRLWLGAVLAAALTAGFVTWLVLRDGDDGGGESAAAPESPRPVGLPADELRAFAAERTQPLFWAGPRSGVTYELTETEDGAVFVRYLPEGVRTGDPRPAFLTIATYPLADGYERVSAASRRPRADAETIAGGGIVVVNERRPSSVYLARRGGRYQVEVYDPSPERARELAVSGRVRPIR